MSRPAATEPTRRKEIDPSDDNGKRVKGRITQIMDKNNAKAREEVVVKVPLMELEAIVGVASCTVDPEGIDWDLPKPELISEIAADVMSAVTDHFTGRAPLDEEAIRWMTQLNKSLLWIATNGS